MQKIAQAKGRDQPNYKDTTAVETWVKGRFKAGMMLSTADNKRHACLKNDLENRHAVDHSDEYPSDTMRLLSQLNNFRPESLPNRSRRRTDKTSDDDDGINFLQDGDEEGDEEQEQQGASFLQERVNRRPTSTTKAKARTSSHIITSQKTNR